MKVMKKLPGRGWPGFLNDFRNRKSRTGGSSADEGVRPTAYKAHFNAAAPETIE